MTTIDTTPDALGAEQTETTSGTLLAGIAAWAISSDHKRIGRLLVGASLAGFVATAVIGVLLGIERVDGGQLVFDATVVGQLFQAHVVGLVFASVLPLGLGLAVAVVPLQLGARALAFPRLALGGFYAWLLGLVGVIVAIASHGGAAGTDTDMVVLFLLGHALMALGLLAVAGAVATSVLTTRAPGMTMRRVPFFTWSALVTSIGLLVALPVMVGAIVYLVVDLQYSQAAFGGAAGLTAWLGWPFSAPTVFLFALPAVGVFAELVPVTFRRAQPGRGFVFAGLALIGVAALAAVTQQAIFNVPWEGTGLDEFGTNVRDLVPWALFHLLPVLGVVIVLALGAFCAIGGKPRITGAFLFAFFGLGMVLVGMLGAALYPIQDLGLQGTVFSEAVLVYVAYGGVLGVLGGLLFWAPKLWGSRVPELMAVPLALVGVLATVLAAFPYYIAGFADQPAASPTFSYSGPEALWNILVLVGHGLMLLTVLAVVALALASARTAGRDTDDARVDEVGDDPWGAHTIEWSAPSPAPGNNFAEVPSIFSAEPMLDLREGVGATTPETDGSPT
jgi:heme/copper-type cytochrome/quinol oxidase subunit 1